MTFGIDPHRWRDNFSFYESALVGLDIVHKRVHDGAVFYASHLIPSLANDGTATYLVNVSGVAAHFTYAVNAGGDAFIYKYEGATVTGNSGTAVSAICMNRYASTQSTVKIFQGPEGVSATGVALGNGRYLPGGGGPNSPGRELRQNTEWILSANQNYVLQVVNKAGLAKPMSISLEWYAD